MALPGVAQTFAIENAADIWDKFRWEIDEYQKEPELMKKLWRAWNCAVTGWHISDWLWKEHQSNSVKNLGTLPQFQMAMRTQCRSLDICRHIATASKHGGVDQRRDTTIQVVVQAKASEVEAAWEDVDDTKGWEMLIQDADRQQDALAIFREVLQFWEKEIFSDERLAEPERFAPNDD